MNAKQKLSSHDLLTNLLAILILILNFNHLVATFPISSSHGNLQNLGRKAGSIDKSRAGLKRASSFSSGSDSSDSESLDSDPRRSKFKRASLTAAGIIKRASAALDADKKLTFIKERWERARRRARSAATSVAASVAPRLKRSPVIVPSAPKSAFELVDLGDNVPSQARTTISLKLVYSPVLTGTPEPKSPVPLRTGCLEFWLR